MKICIYLTLLDCGIDWVCKSILVKCVDIKESNYEQGFYDADKNTNDLPEFIYESLHRLKIAKSKGHL